MNALDNLTTNLVLLTNQSEGGILEGPDDIINIVLLLDFILKWVVHGLATHEANWNLKLLSAHNGHVNN